MPNKPPTKFLQEHPALLVAWHLGRLAGPNLATVRAALLLGQVHGSGEPGSAHWRQFLDAFELGVAAMSGVPSPYEAGYAHGRGVALGEKSAEDDFDGVGYSVADRREFRRGLVEGFEAARGEEEDEKCLRGEDLLY